MSNFALQEIDAVKGKQKFFKLIKDGKCEFDEFEANARTHFNSEMDRMYAVMNRVARLLPMTKDKFRDITPDKDTVKEYEFKTKHLRVYAFNEPGEGKIIVCGEYKNEQDTNFVHLRNIKKLYLSEKDKK